MDILIISPRPELWDGLKNAFAKHGAELRFAASLEDGLAALREKKASLALLDILGGRDWNGEEDAKTLRNAAMAILMVDAMTNMASACGMGHDTFHDAMEGLGMIDDLPAVPAEADVDSLMTRLISILG